MRCAGRSDWTQTGCRLAAVTAPGSNSTPSARRLLALVACGVPLVCLVLAPAAVNAVKPKSGNFRGTAEVPPHPKNNRSVSFRVPSSKKSLRDVRFPSCDSNTRGVPAMKKAKVSEKGKIKGEASIRERIQPEVPGPTEQLRDWTLKITGKFTKTPKAKGRLSVTVRYRTVLNGTETPPPLNARDNTCRTGSVTWKAGRQ